MVTEISWDDFAKIDFRAGTVTRVEDFPEARKPAYKIWVNFGPELGERQTSAQVTELYRPEELMGRQVLGVVNFPPKRIGPFTSEFLLTGFYGPEGVVLAVPEQALPDGSKLG